MAKVVQHKFKWGGKKRPELAASVVKARHFLKHPKRLLRVAKTPEELKKLTEEMDKHLENYKMVREHVRNTVHNARMARALKIGKTL